jgi:hypothetical protein
LEGIDMSNMAKKQSRAKVLRKNRNMRKNNGVGRTQEHQAIHDAAEANKMSLGERLASGMKNMVGRN